MARLLRITEHNDYGSSPMYLFIYLLTYLFIHLFSYFLPNIVRGGAGHVARMEEIRTSYKILVRKPERKRPLGRARAYMER
jgi:hypothetical protein